MPHRIVTCIVIGVALSTAVVLDGQSTSAKATVDKSESAQARAHWSVPRMPDGRPDMQGVWANNNMTPLQRPPQFAGRATMTDAELADLKQKVKALMDGGDAFFADELILAALDGKTKFSSGDTQTGNYDQSWLSERIFDNRTSLIIDPPDGRIPPLAPGAAERARALQAGAAGTRPGRSRAGSLLQHALRQRRHAQHSRRLSELLRDHAGSGRRGAPHRDDSRRAHFPDRRRPARVARHRPVSRRLARALGRGHARGGHDQLRRQRDSSGCRHHEQAAHDRDVQTGRRGHDRVPPSRSTIRTCGRAPGR